MANRFSAWGSALPEQPDFAASLRLSNGATDVFFDVLTLAGSTLAETPWQQNLVLYLADGHRWSRGAAGFDLGEPWTADWKAEHAFFLALVGRAADRHGWDRLGYDPPLIAKQLVAFRSLLAGFRPALVDASRSGDWRTPPPPERLVRCATHDIYRGQFGCRLCPTGTGQVTFPEFGQV